MISICIPIYNFNVTCLVNELSSQINNLNTIAEIILIDDCSKEKYKLENHAVCKKHTYIELKENIGRSKIRNLFLNYAQYDYLLFLDCDSLIINKDFINNYIEAIKSGFTTVICGGRIYDPTKPSKQQILRWKYGINKESQNATIRRKNPFKSFMTNNFLVNKSIFEEIKFDERITKYGHEDTLFGYQLKLKNIHIQHIENPILNGDIEDNKLYLTKTEIGLQNLVGILEYTDFDKKLIDDIKILKFYHGINGFGIFLIKTLFLISKPLIKLLLIKGFANLSIFDFYKLGYFICNFRK